MHLYAGLTVPRWFQRSRREGAATTRKLSRSPISLCVYMYIYLSIYVCISISIYRSYRSALSSAQQAGKLGLHPYTESQSISSGDPMIQRSGRAAASHARCVTHSGRRGREPTGTQSIGSARAAANPT